jgi:hypothetical protein
VRIIIAIIFCLNCLLCIGQEEAYYLNDFMETDLFLIDTDSSIIKRAFSFKEDEVKEIKLGGNLGFHLIPNSFNTL